MISSKCRIRPAWAWLIGILLLALALRLAWVQDAGLVHDVAFFIRWMRLATQHGVGHVFTAAKSSYPPLSVCLLWLLGLFSRAVALDAPPTLAELLALRVTIVFFDLLTIAVLYVVGRRIAGRPAALWAALLYALCPADIYLSGWWVQIEAWFVLPMLVGIWWLSQRRVVPAWIALGVAIALKLQAAVVLPIFVIGTWRWWGLRRLAAGSLALALTLGVIVAPFLLGGQAANLLPKMTQPTRYFQWISQETHNLWFVLTPYARNTGHDVNRDQNGFLGGVSFHDAGLTLLALGYGLMLVRLFVRSGPLVAFAASAEAWLMLFMLPTRIHTRYLFPSLALMLCAGFYQRRWWALYGGAAVTLLVNLLLRVRDILPTANVPAILTEVAVPSAWLNVTIWGLALLFYVLPLFGPVQRQADREGPLRTMKRGWDTALLVLAVAALLSILGAVLWRGRTIGEQIARLRPPLRASLGTSLNAASTSEPVVVVNWPHVIQAGRSAYLGGVIPVIPPALLLDAPEAIRASAAWVQYPPWQQTASLEIEYYGTYVTQAELATLAQQAGEVVAFSPQTHEMFVLAQRRLAVTLPAPCICFGEQACLIAAHAASHDSVLRVELAWQVTTALPADTTVFVHVLDENGDLIAQADGEPAGGLVPLASLSVPGTVLYETRLIPLPPDEYRVRVGLYDRASGERLAAHCQASNVCIDNAIEIPSGHEYGYTD